MAKITRHGGPTVAAAGASTPAPAADTTPEEVASSPGTRSSTSSEKDANSPKRSGSKGRSRARTTGSRSPKARTGGSSAGSTDGDPKDPDA